jgi:hypothetical protein
MLNTNGYDELPAATLLSMLEQPFHAPSRIARGSLERLFGFILKQFLFVVVTVIITLCCLLGALYH